MVGAGGGWRRWREFERESNVKAGSGGGEWAQGCKASGEGSSKQEEEELVRDANRSPVHIFWGGRRNTTAQRVGGLVGGASSGRRRTR